MASPISPRDERFAPPPRHDSASSSAAARLAQAPLAVGFVTYLIAGVRGIAVPGVGGEVYAVAGAILLVPILAYGVPLALLLGRWFPKLVWLAVLAGEVVIVGLSLSAGPSVEAVGFAYGGGVALWAALRPLLPWGGRQPELVPGIPSVAASRSSRQPPPVGADATSRRPDAWRRPPHLVPTLHRLL